MSSIPKPLLLVSFICLFLTINATQAEEAAVADKPAASGSAKKAVEPQTIKLAEGKLLLPVPGDWKSVRPRSRIIHHEFSIAPAKGDETAGRMTVMPSGGGIEANIARWEGQFKSADGKALGDEAKKVEKQKIGDLTVHVVDFKGTFIDSIGGPFSGRKVDRPDYRMLAAIVPLKQGGTWFIKSYGPQATMKSAEKGFGQMIEGVKLTK